MTRTILLLAALLALTGLFVACGGARPPAPAPLRNQEEQAAPAPTLSVPARFVERTATTGVLELAGDRSAAMRAAEREMAAHCGANHYLIVRDGEERIGTRRAASGDIEPLIAWRIHYGCLQRPRPASP